MEAENNLILPITFGTFGIPKNVENLFDQVFPKMFLDKAFVLSCKMKALNEKEKLNQRMTTFQEKNMKKDGNLGFSQLFVTVFVNRKT